MESKNEYFNLFVQRDKLYGDLFDDVNVIALTKDEVLQYFDYLSKGKLGKQPIGNRKVEIIEPESYSIYDFSTFLLNNPGAEKSDYIKAVKKRVKNGEKPEDFFSELGEDVTESFKIRLENILKISSIPGSISTTETMTTTSKTIQNDIGNPDNQILDRDNVERSEDGKGVISGTVIETFTYLPKEFTGRIIDATIDPTFNVEKIANVFANHLKNLKHENGQMVGVFGKWGRGKTFFVNEVCKCLKIDYKEGKFNKDSDFIFVKFQAWKYQGTPSIWAYLFESCINKYLEVPWYYKIGRTIRFSIARNGKWNTLIKPLIFIAISIAWIFLIPLIVKIEILAHLIQLSGGIFSFLVLAYNISSFVNRARKPAEKIFDALSEIPSFKNILGIQAEIQQELASLIQTWVSTIGRKRILLFIDDLDRCSEDKMVEIVDAFRIMLDDPKINNRIVILVAVDETILKNAVDHKYKKRRGAEDLVNFSVEYLDKLFISAIKLHPISFEQRIVFVEKLAYQINNTNPATGAFIQQKEAKTVSEKTVDDENQDEFIDMASSVLIEKKLPEDMELILFSLQQFEIDLLKNKVRHVSRELTPRQIRIFIFRYLLARNIWRSLFEGIEFKTEETIDIILNQAFGEPAIKFDFDKDLNEVVQMVVTH